MPIKMINCALDVVTIDGKESLAIRGVVVPTSFEDILVPKYQRDILPVGKIDGLKKAIEKGRVPDIDLGMRGSAYTDKGKGVFILEDDVYVIDGLQRKTAGERLLAAGIPRSLGAIVHIDTTEAWERERFEALNTGQTGLSNNVMLRNMAEDHLGARVMLSLTESPTFAFQGKVTWTQSMRRSDLITAITFYKVVGRLCSHRGPGKSDPRTLARTGIEKIIANMGKQNFTVNVKYFFEFLDKAYQLNDVFYRNHSTALKATFLLAVAGVISDHENFWTGERLEIPDDMKRRFAALPLGDQYVKGLASSSGNAVLLLQTLIEEHLDAKRRTRKLQRRKDVVKQDGLSTEAEDSSDGVA